MENSKEYNTNELQNYLRQWKLDAIRESIIDSEEQDIEKVNILKELCSKGADLDYLEMERGFFCIPNVFWSQRLIKFFIEAGRDVNSQDENGNTALHLALIYAGYYEQFGKKEIDLPVSLIKFLLDENANPNVANLNGNTALFNLAIRIDEESILQVAKMLLQKGAKIAIQNNQGMSLLHRIQIYDCPPRSVTNWFIKKFDGDINLKTSECFYSQTPLMIAAQWSSRRLDNCRMLIRRGADVNAKDLQGYTALHHAINVVDKHKCSKFLIDSGTDPNAKTASGKDAYELAIHKNCEFTYGATPKKQAEVLEMAVAKAIMHLSNSNLHFDLLDKAMDVYKTYDLKPSDEFLASSVFIKENKNNPKELYGAAMKTVARLSSSDISKFWNLLAFAPKCDILDRSELRVSHIETASYVFETFHFLSFEFKRVNDFASLEGIDLRRISQLASFFDSLLDRLFFSRSLLIQEKSKAIREGISHFHSIVSLAIACIEKLRQETKSQTLHGDVFCYLKMYHFIKTLVFIRNSVGDIIPEATIKHNERLLMYFIKLELVYNKGETSSLHKMFATDIKLLDSILDARILGFKEMNKIALLLLTSGFPLTDGKRLEYVLRFADRGAHVDARNYDGEKPTIKELLEKNQRNSSFPCDSLQCMCARVLVRSLVPFRNRVPKCIVNFILEH